MKLSPRTRAAAALACALVTSSVAATAAEVAQIKVGAQAAETSTTTANSYYGTGLTSTREIWGPDPTANRPAELKELARALRYNVDLIYEYVHDNVRTVFMYGLQKGALGAVIDQSGTPFDQAHLMVELLRESGYSARFKVGTLQLSSTQANDWVGTSNSTALRQIFRDGGIPLNYNSSGPTYTIGHVWVEVTIPGSACNTTCWFNPSYKQHTFKPQLALETLMGWGANEFSTTEPTGFLMNAWSGMTQQGTPAVPVWVSNVNDTNIQSKLTTYSTNLLTQLKSAAHKDKELEDVIGGQDIVKTGATPIRNGGSLPGFTTAVQRTWDCTGSTTCGVPDPYRTKVTIALDEGVTFGGITINKTLYADEIYGRRIYFDMPLELSLPGQDPLTPSYEPWCVKLTVDGNPVANAQSGCATPVELRGLGRRYDVRLEVDHPYAASSGAYMDNTVALGSEITQRSDFAMPVVVILGLGDVSAALASKLASEQLADRLLPITQPPPPAEPGDVRGDGAMDHTMVKLGANFLGQYSRMAEMQKRIGNSEHVMHHMLGVAYAEAWEDNSWPGNLWNTTLHDWSIGDRAIRISASGAISINSKTAVALDRQKVIQSTLAAASMLEGSLFEQELDTVGTGSTATRFQWGNASISGLKFYLYTEATPDAQVGSGFTSLGCDPATGGGGGVLGVQAYVNTNNFWAISPNETCLGPGNKHGPKRSGNYQASMQRGSAFFAFKPDNSTVAHVLNYGIPGVPITSYSQVYKGGGAGVPPEYDREFDPTGAANLLKDKFEDRSRLHGVDLQSGELSYSAPVDIRLGEGGFPYELSLSRTFKSGSTKSPGLTEGWAHNLDLRASISGGAMPKLGESAWGAAETIAAIYTAQKIFSVSPAPPSSPTATQQRDHLKRWVLAPFVMSWLGTKLSYNTVTLNAGHDARQFVHYADGAFYPPRNGVGTLVQTGARTAILDQDLPSGQGNYTRWDYSAISFTYTSPEKDQQTYAYRELENAYSPTGVIEEAAVGRRFGWWVSNWTFPFGVSVTFSYSNANPLGAGYPKEDRLTSVSNNLGRTLSFSYSGDLAGVDLTSVSDGQGRTVTYAQPQFGGNLLSVTSPESGNGAEISKYDYVGGGVYYTPPAGTRPSPFPRLLRVFAPSDANFARMEFGYDTLWRVQTMKDAVAVKTPSQRQPWTFFISGTNRGVRQDPLLSEYTAYYDTRARAIRYTDEEGRVVTQKFDNRDRVTERTFPEGNKVQLVYDDATQQVKQITQIPKSTAYYSTVLPNIVVSATYDAACAKIKTVTDARGKVTTWNYNATTCTLTNVQQPQVPNPELGGSPLQTPTTAYLYNGFGQLTQVTDPTGRIVTFDYHAATNYRLHRYVNPAGLNLTTTYGHNNYGDINSITDPRGAISTITYIYDKQRRLAQINAPLGSITKNTYDLDGDVIRVERAKNDPPTQWQAWQVTYTPTKLVESEVSPLAETSWRTYDALDREVLITDAAGRKVLARYFRDGKIMSLTRAHQSISMPAITYSTYSYSPNGQIDIVTDAKANATNLDYDGFDRLARTFYSDPTSGTPCIPALPHSAAAPSCGANQRYEEFGYDPSGNTTSRRNRSSAVITSIFDDINRETTRGVPANSLGHFARTLTNTYDLAGRRYDASADGQSISHRYDAVGRVDTVTDSLLSPTGTADYGYDAAGNRTTLIYPSGTQVTFSYDALNRLNAAMEGGVTLADYDWDVLSRRDLMRRNNSAITSDFDYKDNDDLEAISHTGPVAIGFTIGRNAVGQISGLSATDGAFLSRPPIGLTDSYSPNRLNQLSQLNTQSVGYDANGNLTSDGVLTLEHDEEGRLRAATGTGLAASYEYDPLGRRRAKIVNGVLTKYASDAADEIEERDPANAVLRRFVYGPGIDEHIAMLDPSCGGGRCFSLPNWQNSSIAEVGQDGVVRATYHYGPFGEGQGWSPQDSPSGDPFRFMGRRLDPETGLYYFRARYYSTRLGSFLQPDPSGTRDDLNLYAFVAGDPLNRVDPTGRDGFSLFAPNDALEPRAQALIKHTGSQAFIVAAHGFQTAHKGRWGHVEAQDLAKMIVDNGYRGSGLFVLTSCVIAPDYARAVSSQVGALLGKEGEGDGGPVTLYTTTNDAAFGVSPTEGTYSSFTSRAGVATLSSRDAHTPETVGAAKASAFFVRNADSAIENALSSRGIELVGVSVDESSGTASFTFQQARPDTSTRIRKTFTVTVPTCTTGTTCE